MKNPSPSPNPPPVKNDRILIADKVPRYIRNLLLDYKNTIPIAANWDLIERIILASQRELNSDAGCQAASKILETFEVFKTQGALDIRTAQDKK